MYIVETKGGIYPFFFCSFLHMNLQQCMTSFGEPVSCVGEITKRAAGSCFPLQQCYCDCGQFKAQNIKY